MNKEVTMNLKEFDKVIALFFKDDKPCRGLRKANKIFRKDAYALFRRLCRFEENIKAAEEFIGRSEKEPLSEKEIREISKGLDKCMNGIAQYMHDELEWNCERKKAVDERQAKREYPFPVVMAGLKMMKFETSLDEERDHLNKRLRIIDKKIDGLMERGFITKDYAEYLAEKNSEFRKLIGLENFRIFFK
jgi:hypothetical protein